MKLAFVDGQSASLLPSRPCASTLRGSLSRRHEALSLSSWNSFRGPPVGFQRHGTRGSRPARNDRIPGFVLGLEAPSACVLALSRRGATSCAREGSEFRRNRVYNRCVSGRSRMQPRKTVRLDGSDESRCFLADGFFLPRPGSSREIA